MQRIVIVGPGGAGKSVLARKMGERLHLPVIHLDAHHWKPGWVSTPKGEWAERVRELLAGDRWIADGNYGGTARLRVAAADTIVFLDFPRRITIPRVVMRRLRHRGGRTRADMAEGCPERLTLQFVRFLWRYPREGRRRMLSAIEDEGAHARLIVLRSPREVARFLSSLPPT